MTNYILINRTYAETTPESAEIGDFSDTGFIEQDEQVTFRQLVELMRDYPHASQSPHDGNIDVSHSTSWYTSDYRTGTNRGESIHYSHNNTPNCAKYWRLAHKAAQLIQERRNKALQDGFS
jgi:hypothetical protein